MSATRIHEVLEVVLFSAGGWRVGFEARLVRGSRPAPGIKVDSESGKLFGLPPNANAATYQYLTLKRPQQDRDILVAGPVELASLPVAAIHPLPPLLAARTALHGLRALLQLADSPGDQNIALLFDADTIPLP